MQQYLIHLLHFVTKKNWFALNNTTNKVALAFAAKTLPLLLILNEGLFTVHYKKRSWWNSVNGKD